MLSTSIYRSLFGGRWRLVVLGVLCDGRVDVVSIRVELVRGVRVASAARRMPENATAPVSTRPPLGPRVVCVVFTGGASAKSVITKVDKLSRVEASGGWERRSNALARIALAVVIRSRAAHLTPAVSLRCEQRLWIIAAAETWACCQ